MHREDVFSCSMSEVDVKTVIKESRKRQQEEKERKMKMRYEENMTEGINQTECELSSLTPNLESEEDEEYQPTQTMTCTPTISTTTACASSLKKKFMNIFQSPEVVGPWIAFAPQTVELSLLSELLHRRFAMTFQK